MVKDIVLTSSRYQLTGGFSMAQKPTYEELEQRVKKLTDELLERDQMGKEVERIFNFSMDMIGSGNLEGYFTKINSSFRKLLGYSKKEILARPFIKFVHDDDVEKTKKALVDAAKGKKEIYIVNRYKCKDGSHKWIEWKVLSIVKENKFIAVGRDITEHKRFEEKLQESKAKFEAVVESLPFDVFALDPNNRYYMQNAICRKNWGDVIGKCPEDLPVSKETLNLWLKNNRRAFSGETVADEVQYHNLEGEKGFYYNIIAPIRDEEKIFGILGILLDISELKKVEEALKESEERYRSLFMNNHSVMLIIDPESADIVDANPAATSFYEWSYEELTRKKLTDINTLTERQVFQEMKRAKLKGGRVFHFKHRLASGKIRDVEVYSGPIKVYGRELLYSIIHDITKRRQAELSLIEKRKELENKTHELEEVNAALKVLLKQRDEDKKEFEEKIIANVKNLVFPYIGKLNNSRLNDRQTVYLEIIKSNLEEVIAPFLHRLSSKYSDLTPSEIQIAGLIKDGKTTKEIAELLNSSTDAIDFHRYNLRKKLGLRNRKTNLRSFLLSLV
jgi:PAS domain S-box-containing protein